MTQKRINVSQPCFLGMEGEFVEACLSDPPRLSMGAFTKDFEEIYADWVGVKHAVSVSNGTVALQLAFRVLAEKAGGGSPGYCPRVFIPNLTYIATASAPWQWRDRWANLVAVDSKYTTWNMDADYIWDAKPSKGDIIIPVHLYGNPCDMAYLWDIASEFGCHILEDACQAHGADYRGIKVGACGDMGVFSFFGNKILTTGEGGMITTNDPELADRCRYLRGQAVGPGRYEHRDIGYNFRPTEISSAIGIGQTMLANNHIEARRDIREMYRERLELVDVEFQKEEIDGTSVPWLETIRLAPGVDVPEISRKMDKLGIGTRPTFTPITKQQPYAGIAKLSDMKVSDALSKRLISLPTHPHLNMDDVDRVCSALLEVGAWPEF